MASLDRLLDDLGVRVDDVEAEELGSPLAGELGVVGLAESMCRVRGSPMVVGTWQESCGCVGLSCIAVGGPGVLVLKLVGWDGLGVGVIM